MGRIEELNKLGKILIGDKNITDEPIDSIIKHLIHGNMTPIYIVYLKIGLERGIINADKLLVDSIVNIIERRDEYEDIDAHTLLSLCIPMCLGIRYGANVNAIINNMHMLVYVYLELDGNIDDRIFDMVVTILLLSGVDVTLPAFESDHISDMMTGGLLDEQQSEIKNVMEYLTEENHSIDIGFVKKLREGKIPENIPWILGVLLDNTELINIQGKENFLTDMFGQDIDFNVCIYIHASKFIPRIYKDEYMCTAIKSLNVEAYIQLLHINSQIPYNIINDILISYKTYRQSSDIICEGIIKTMLDMGMYKGVKLDQFQMEYLSDRGNDLMTERLSDRGNDLMTERLSDRGNDLMTGELRHSKVQQDKSEYKKSNDAWMIPELDRELIDCLVYKQGEECYNFEIKDLDTIITTKKNTYTNTDIEGWYISKIKSQRSALKRLGLTKVHTQKTDSIIELTYEDMLNNMSSVGIMYGITRQHIMNIDVKSMCILCKLLNIDVSITCLNPQHRLPTFIYSVYPVICKPEMCELLYRGIQEIQRVD